MPRLLSIALGCLAFASCSVNAETKASQNFQNRQLANKIEATQQTSQIPSLEGNQNQKASADDWKKISNDINIQEGNKSNNKSQNKSQKVSVGPGYQTNGNYMLLKPTTQANALGNPLYELQVFANGQLVGSFMTVSGRTHTQSKNRHQSGTHAPLPDGKYRIAKSTTRGTIAEAGDRFLGLTPTFRTGRTALGIHYDPSYEKTNGEDGTSGCIGLKNRDELSQLLTLIRTHKPQFLDVDIL